MKTMKFMKESLADMPTMETLSDEDLQAVNGGQRHTSAYHHCHGRRSRHYAYGSQYYGGQSFGFDGQPFGFGGQPFGFGGQSYGRQPVGYGSGGCHDDDDDTCSGN